MRLRSPKPPIPPRRGRSSGDIKRAGIKRSARLCAALRSFWLQSASFIAACRRRFRLFFRSKQPMPVNSPGADSISFRRQQLPTLIQRSRLQLPRRRRMRRRLQRNRQKQKRPLLSLRQQNLRPFPVHEVIPKQRETEMQANLQIHRFYRQPDKQRRTALRRRHKQCRQRFRQRRLRQQPKRRRQLYR